MKVSFVYPMFNEVGNIEEVIRSTNSLASRSLSDFEIIIVNDGSTDGSGELCESMRAKYPKLRVLHHERNRKLGGALKTGFAAAYMDYVLYMDSDLPVTFDDVEKALRETKPGEDMVIGFRVGRVEGVYRNVQSWVYNALLYLVFRLQVRDANFSFKLFRRDLLSFATLRSDSSFIDAELLLEARRCRYAIREIGFRYHVRRAGKSTIGGPRVIPRLLHDMLRYWCEFPRKVSPQQRYVIFNADDFGLCPSINAGVIESHERGVVRAASVIATGDAFEDAANFARNNPSLDIGAHLSLCDGKPVSDAMDIPSLVSKEGRFHNNYIDFVASYLCGRISHREIEREFRAQIAKIRAVGLPISHLDSHQHLHALPGIYRIVFRLAEENGIRAIRHPHERPAWRELMNFRVFRALQRYALSLTLRKARRGIPPSRVQGADHFFGVMHAGRWNNKTLRETIEALPPGVTEICCHPRSEPADEPGYDWSYKFREELDALTSEELRATLKRESVSLTFFSERFL